MKPPFHAMAALVALVIAGAASAAPPPACSADTCYSQAEAREDLAVLYRQLRENHFDLYARRPQADYDRLYADLLDSLDGPIARPQFHQMLHRLLAYGEVGHAKTEVAVLDGLAHVQAGGSVIPLSVRYHGSDMILEEWADATESMPPGSRITSLGGMEMSAFEARARTLISADTDALLRAQLEQGLPIYLYLLFGDVPGLEVGFVRPDGVTSTHHVPALSYPALMTLAQERPVARPARDSAPRNWRLLDAGVFYLRPGPFSALETERGDGGDAYAIGGFRAFVEAAFAALEDSGAEDLVIDLRGNGGGDVSFSDLIMARIAGRPFSFASRYAVRAGALTQAAWADYGGPQDTLGGSIARGLAETPTGEVFELELPRTAPAQSGRFDGQVWVLIDRHSYSNAAVVAAQVQDYDFGTLMGEATADLATTYGAVESFTLPHSGAQVYYPKAWMVRPSGSEAVAGVQPDVPLAPQPVGVAEDRVLAAALAHIHAQRDGTSN